MSTFVLLMNFTDHRLARQRPYHDAQGIPRSGVSEDRRGALLIEATAEE